MMRALHSLDSVCLIMPFCKTTSERFAIQGRASFHVIEADIRASIWVVPGGSVEARWLQRGGSENVAGLALRP